jgi:hypothetical protein
MVVSRVYFQRSLAYPQRAKFIDKTIQADESGGLLSPSYGGE